MMRKGRSRAAGQTGPAMDGAGRRRSFLERLVRAHFEAYDEATIRRAVSESVAGPFGDPGAALRDLSLVDALEQDVIGERDLSQVTERWTVVPESPTDLCKTRLACKAAIRARLRGETSPR